MTSGTQALGTVRDDRAAAWSSAAVTLWLAAALAAALATAFLVAEGYWYAVVALLLVLPAFLLVHRYPYAAILIWLLVLPLVAVTESDAVRKVFWLVHRAMPPAVLIMIVLAVLLRLHRRTLPRPTWPEFMMAGYVTVTFLSILYLSRSWTGTSYTLYDNVVAPMCLYLVVRAVQPDEHDLRRLLPVALFILLSQTAFGILQWTFPDVLPAEWLGKLFERTTGSLRSPEMYGTTLLFCGLLLLHGGLSKPSGAASRFWAVLLFAVMGAMVFMTFSRSVWSAGLLATTGAIVLHRNRAQWLVAVLVPVLALVVASGVLTQQFAFAQQRYQSQESRESALSRLPVVYAAARMFKAKPVFGWGYEQFDRFDLQYQSRVGGLVYPEKDHASHNLYLTTLAEQGLVGFVLYLGPVAYWLRRTQATWSRMPADGFASRRLVGLLWLVMASHFVVSNFYRMQVSIGLGMWWLTLGLIATLVYGFEQLAADEAGGRPA